MAVRRGKFRAFLKPDPSSIKYDEHSFTNSQDGEISVEIAVGPKGKTSYKLQQTCLSIQVGTALLNLTEKQLHMG